MLDSEINSIAEQQAGAEIQKIRGKKEVWVDFMDDFHQEVPFDTVADQARKHGYIFVY